MARLLLLAVWSACLAGALRGQEDVLEDILEDEDDLKPRWLGGEKCEDLVPNSKPSRLNWIRFRRCKCPAGRALVGPTTAPTKACGDGTRTLFRASTVKGQDCRCERLLLCPKVTTQPNFNLDVYISKPWFIQQQMETQYLPKKFNFCVNAKYTKQPSKTKLWGYTIAVHNRAYAENGEALDTGADFLKAYNYDRKDPAKLAVAPWFVPKAFSGNYWVLAHNETAGYSLISGGQPKVRTPFGCRTSTGTNDAGLWIFTRDPQPEWSVIEKVRGIARAQGFDLSILNNVSHANCAGKPNYP